MVPARERVILMQSPRFRPSPPLSLALLLKPAQPTLWEGCVLSIPCSYLLLSSCFPADCRVQTADDSLQFPKPLKKEPSSSESCGAHSTRLSSREICVPLSFDISGALFTHILTH